MTRLWNVDVTYLCRGHLLGEHAEMHQEAGTVENHPHGEAVARGHAKQAQVDTRLIQHRHDELAAEMERRGFDHESEMEYDDSLNLGYVDEHANLAELYDRCDACAERIREMS